MGGKFKSRMKRPDVRSCSYWLLHDRLCTTRYDEKTRKGEGEKNKMPRKKFSHSKFLKQNCFLTLHTPGQWEHPILIFKAVGRIDNTQFCYRTSIISRCCLHFDISDQPIVAWKYSNNFARLPLSSDRVRISNDDPIIHGNISVFSIPLLSWNQIGQYGDRRSPPERVNNSLTKFKTMPRVLSFPKRSLWDSTSSSA